MGNGTASASKHDAAAPARGGSRCSTTPPSRSVMRAVERPRPRRRRVREDRATGAPVVHPGGISAPNQARRACSPTATYCRAGARGPVFSEFSAEGRLLFDGSSRLTRGKGQLPRDPRALDRHAGHEAGGRRAGRPTTGGCSCTRAGTARPRSPAGRCWRADRAAACARAASKARDGFETEIDREVARLARRRAGAGRARARLGTSRAERPRR